MEHRVLNRILLDSPWIFFQHRPPTFSGCVSASISATSGRGSTFHESRKAISSKEMALAWNFVAKNGEKLPSGYAKIAIENGHL